MLVVLLLAAMFGASVALGRAMAAEPPLAEVAAGSVPDEADEAGAASFSPAELPHAGLVPEQTPAMRAAIETVPVGDPVRHDGAPAGAFDPSPGSDVPGVEAGCVERNRLLPRDLAPITFGPSGSGCIVASGVLDDPYLGRTMPYLHDQRAAVAVDRIVSLDYAWQHGAARWTDARRQAFARDARNQVVVDARTVETKAGRGPGSWLPPNVAIRCAYAARFAEVATAYGLTVTEADREVARRQCSAP